MSQIDRESSSSNEKGLCDENIEELRERIEQYDSQAQTLDQQLHHRDELQQEIDTLRQKVEDQKLWLSVARGYVEYESHTNMSKLCMGNNYSNDMTQYMTNIITKMPKCIESGDYHNVKRLARMAMHDYTAMDVHQPSLIFKNIFMDAVLTNTLICTSSQQHNWPKHSSKLDPMYMHKLHFYRSVHSMAEEGNITNILSQSDIIIQSLVAIMDYEFKILLQTNETETSLSIIQKLYESILKIIYEIKPQIASTLLIPKIDSIFNDQQHSLDAATSRTKRPHAANLTYSNYMNQLSSFRQAIEACLQSS